MSIYSVFADTIYIYTHEVCNAGGQPHPDMRTQTTSGHGTGTNANSRHCRACTHSGRPAAGAWTPNACRGRRAVRAESRRPVWRPSSVPGTPTCCTSRSSTDSRRRAPLRTDGWRAESLGRAACRQSRTCRCDPRARRPSRVCVRCAELNNIYNIRL